MDLLNFRRRRHKVHHEAVKYSVLDEQRQQIRLFRVSRVRENVVTGSLHDFDLDQAPPFQALSYVWGSVKPVKTLEVNGQHAPIRMNLYRFLSNYASLAEAEFTQAFPAMSKATRRPDAAFLWIDQICIDQSNVLERNSQIKLMGTIFSSAVEVICWPSDSAREMKLIESALSLWRDDPQAHGIALRGGTVILKDRQMGKAERTLAFAQYWSRIWIQQEILLAQRVTLFSGSTTLDWDDFVHDFTHEQQVSKQPALSQLVERRKTRPPGTERLASLREAIINTRETKSSDEKDTIFAMMGLVYASERLPVDYSMSKEQIWWLVVQKVTIEAQLPLTTSYSPRNDLQLMLYSRKASRLGVNDERLRVFIRNFVLGFWTSWNENHNLTLPEYMRSTQDPFERWMRLRESKFLAVREHFFLIERIILCVCNRDDGCMPKVVASSAMKLSFSTIFIACFTITISFSFTRHVAAVVVPALGSVLLWSCMVRMLDPSNRFGSKY